MYRDSGVDSTARWANVAEVRALPAVGACGQRPLLGHVLFSAEEWDAILRSLPLTDRQQDVVLGLFDCKSEQAIGNELGIQPSTVHKYVQEIYVRLGVHCRMGLSLRIMEIWMQQNVLARCLSPEQAAPKRGDRTGTSAKVKQR